MNCRNCQAPLTGSYCHSCGQKVLTRFSFRSLFEWFSEEVVVVDRGFLFTLKELLLRPANVSSDYISGCTRRYYNPFKLLIVVTTIPFLLISLTPDFDGFPGNLELLKQAPPAFTGDFFRYFQTNWPEFIVINFLGYFLITIPFWALFGWLLFRSAGLTYIEHLIFVSFLACSNIVLLFCLAPVNFLLITISQLESVFLLMLPSFILVFLNCARSAKSFYKGTYTAVILKGIVSAYAGLVASSGLQFVVLSVWRVFLQ